MASIPDPIISLSVEHVTSRTVVLEVCTSAPVHLVWPYVRANGHVPDAIRAVSAVFTRKLETDNAEEVRASLLDDVSWRWDRGYVNAAKYTDGWMFAWSEGERD